MSSDDEGVRRPGRGAGANNLQSPTQSDARNDSGAEDNDPTGAGGGPADEDEDADLFGSDGEEGGLETLEYGIFWRATE